MATIDIPIGTSISSINTTLSSVVAGDIVRFEAGGSWTGKVTVNGRNGNSSNYITITSYGTGAKPIINTRIRVPNSNVLGSWTEETNNIWSLPLNSNPITVDFRIWTNGVELPRQYGPNVTALRPVGHDTDYNKLYIYSATDPVSEYPLIEYPSHETATLLFSSSSYIILDGLDIRGSSGGTVDFSSSNNIIIRNCEIGRDAGRNGIRCGTTGQNTDILIEDNIVDSGDVLQDIYYISHGVSDGISMYGGAHRWTIRRNLVKNWGHSCIEISNVYGGTDTSMSDILIEDNDLTAPDVDYCRGFALNSVEGRSVTNVVATRNYVHDMTIMNQLSLPNLTFSYNIIANITRSTNPAFSGSEWNAKGIFISGYGGMSPINMKVYNNIVYNTADAGIWIAAAPSYGAVNNIDITNNIVANTGNNSLFGYDNYQIIITQNTGSTVGAITMRDNLLYKSGVTNIYYDNLSGTGTAYSISGMNGRNGVASLTVSNNTVGDPLFVNAASNNFTLQSPSSPALDTGLTLTGYEIGLSTNSVWPTGVVTVSQDSTWNKGAYAGTANIARIFGRAISFSIFS